VLINILRVGLEYPTWHTVVYRTAGNDFLRYESLARSILETGSLRGGEDLFWAQPGIRYILVGLRSLFGDGDPILAVVSRSSLSLGVLFLVAIGCAKLGRHS